MNPNPFEALNHLTTPCSRANEILLRMISRSGACSACRMRQAPVCPSPEKPSAYKAPISGGIMAQTPFVCKASGGLRAGLQGLRALRALFSDFGRQGGRLAALDQTQTRDLSRDLLH